MTRVGILTFLNGCEHLVAIEANWRASPPKPRQDDPFESLPRQIRACLDATSYLNAGLMGQEVRYPVPEEILVVHDQDADQAPRRIGRFARSRQNRHRSRGGFMSSILHDNFRVLVPGSQDPGVENTWITEISYSFRTAAGLRIELNGRGGRPADKQR